MSVRRVAITGAGGQLGQELVRAFSGSFEVYPFTSAEVDIADRDSVAQSVGVLKLDAVVNAAAYTDVDGCESNVERAFATNALGARNVALAAGEALVCHISTDYVFDGGANSYNEWDQPAPLNIYGKSKLGGEQEIASHASHWLTVRTSWVYGVTGRNFVRTMLRLAAEGGQIEVVDDQRGAPTYAADLAETIYGLVAARREGMVHATNSGAASWCEFARSIFELAGHDPGRISPVDSNANPRPATRPASSLLENSVLNSWGVAPMRHWQDALEECIGRIRANEPEVFTAPG